MDAPEIIPAEPTTPTKPMKPTFGEALRFWLKLGLISFGGPAGQISIMHEELVERKRWVSEGSFLHALNYCMLLPGPEAQQLATYLGWMLHRTWGGIVAGLLFVLPSAVILWVLSLLYVLHGQTVWMAGVFDGLKPAVVAIIAGAAWRIGKKTLRNAWLWSLAGAALLGVAGWKVPFPVVVLAAGVLGWLLSKRWPEKFQSAGHGGHGGKADTTETLELPVTEPASWGRAVRVTLVCLVLWWAPILATGACLGWQGTHFQMGLFFSKAAMVTFGGAYAVLPYVSQQAVEHYGWLQPGQMLDGLGLAETTPGPLIMVLQFAGFVGAWQHPGGLSPIWSATLGAALTTWATFLPCFLWIFLGAPHVEGLRKQARLSAALTAITAAVVGVMVNLGLWFAWHVLVREDHSIQWVSLGIAVVAWVALQHFKANVILVVLASGAIGAALAMLR